MVGGNIFAAYILRETGSCEKKYMHTSLCSWRYCVIKVSAVELRSKKGTGTAAPPPNHSTSTQYHQLRRLHAYLQFCKVVTIQDLWNSICKQQKKSMTRKENIKYNASLEFIIVLVLIHSWSITFFLQ